MKEILLGPGKLGGNGLNLGAVMRNSAPLRTEFNCAARKTAKGRAPGPNIVLFGQPIGSVCTIRLPDPCNRGPSGPRRKAVWPKQQANRNPWKQS